MTFQEFLIKLARSEEFRKEYLEHPEAVLEAEGLSGPKFGILSEILRHGTVRQVRVIVEAELELDGENVTISTVDLLKTNIYIAPQDE